MKNTLDSLIRQAAEMEQAIEACNAQGGHDWAPSEETHYDDFEKKEYNLLRCKKCNSYRRAK